MISPQDFPSLGQAAGKASLDQQRLYLNLFRLSLGLMVTGAFVSTVSGAYSELRPAGLVAGAILLAVSLVLTSAIKIRAPERIWFGGRAVAESVKTVTWRYMTCAEPFDNSLAMRVADDQFMKELQAILKERKQLAWNLGGTTAGLPQITAVMRNIRQADLATRKQIYRDERIVEQRTWYSGKAESNRRDYNGWFWATVAGQLAALLWAIAMVWRVDFTLNLTGVFSSVVAALIAWSQVKRYQELAQAYSLAAHELGMILEKLIHINTESDFASFVGDAENAISREHTLWIARRDTA